MKKFKVGDHVRVVREFMSTAIRSSINGKTGVIVEIDRAAPYPYLVSLDGRDYRTTVYEVERINEKHPVIVITTDGVTTTATKRLGKKVICTATARCSDNDTFDFNTGAELAFQRLREKERPVPKETPPWPKKLVCVEANEYPEDFGVGRVYLTERTVEDFGLLRLEDGTSWGIVRTSDTEFRVNLFSDIARFIPLVED